MSRRVIVDGREYPVTDLDNTETYAYSNRLRYAPDDSFLGERWNIVAMAEAYEELTTMPAAARERAVKEIKKQRRAARVMEENVRAMEESAKKLEVKA
jgi:hypothetical protein